MCELLEFKTSRDYLRYRVSVCDDARSAFVQWANETQIAVSTLIAVWEGNQVLDPDQAAALCDLWDLDLLDTQYFMTLVALENASTSHFQTLLSQRLQQLGSRKSLRDAKSCH